MVMTGHGGNIYRFAEKLGLAENEILDFSASMNPLGVPDSVTRDLRGRLASCRHYPDPDCRRLVALLAKQEGVARDSIICGNGSTELIYLVARALRPARVLIPAPTFSEYERACMTTGRAVRIMRHALKAEDDFAVRPGEFIKRMKGCSLAFICNPNNPTGKVLPADAVREIAGAAKYHKCHLVVDEAFIDFCPEHSVIGSVRDNPYLIVLRSMTKFYALAGFRIGYGVFPRRLVPLLKECKEPWTVNSVAQRAAEVVLKDRSYRERTFGLIGTEKRFLEKGFRRLGLDFFGSEANFYLLKTGKAGLIRKGLAVKGILVRGCSNFAGLDRTYFRVAVRSRKENSRLLREMEEIVKRRIP
jgi:threonine-phosphate decarboxylase